MKIINNNDGWISLKDINNCIYILEPNEEAEVRVNKEGLFIKITITKRNNSGTEKPRGFLNWPVPPSE